MEKKTVLAIFLTLVAAMVVMGVVELVAGSIGGTPLVIVCYVIIAAVLAAILIKTSRQEKDVDQENNANADCADEKAGADCADRNIVKGGADADVANMKADAADANANENADKGDGAR